MPTWRLIPPASVHRYRVKGSLQQEQIVESHVAGDDSALTTYPDSAEIPFGVKHMWLGGHINTTEDPAIKALWEAHGYSVEEWFDEYAFYPSDAMFPSGNIYPGSGPY